MDSKLESIVSKDLLIKKGRNRVHSVLRWHIRKFQRLGHREIDFSYTVYDMADRNAMAIVSTAKIAS